MIFSPYSIIAIHPSSAAILWDQRRTRSARREGAILRDHMTSYSAFHHATIRDRFAHTHTYQYAALLLLRLHGQAREDYGPEGKGR